MFVELNRELFEMTRNLTSEQKLDRAEELILEKHNYVDTIRYANEAFNIYRVDKLPDNDILNGIEWIELKGRD